MKKKILIILGIIVALLIIGYGIIFYTDYQKVLNGELPIFVIESDNQTYKGLGYIVKVQYYENTDDIEEINMSMFGKTVAGIVICKDGEEIKNNDENAVNSEVIIENGKIRNEELIDKFIEYGENHQASTLQINTINNDVSDIIKLEYIPGEYDYSGETTNVAIPSSGADAQEYQRVYGYYMITVNDEEKGKYDSFSWDIKRKTINNEVNLIFEGYLIETTDMITICKYNLDDSLYERKYDELTYMQRKDMGVEQIAKENQFDNSDFGVYTFGGDVNITIEKDMVYTLEDALSNNVITVQDILVQAKQDEKYGICEIGYFSDGGSTEYLYDDFTILKYNTLDGNKDLVIGMRGSILNQLKEIGYKN